MALGLALLLAACGGGKKPPGPPPPAVTVIKALQKEVTDWDDYTGRLAAVDEVDVRAQVSGYLESIHFKDGQMVKKGDLLFVIDPRPYQAVFDRAAAQQKEAEAGLALADANLKRTEELATKKVVASQDLDDQRSKQLGAAAALQVAQAEVKAAQLNLDFTRITAPVSGRINRHVVSEGNLISGGAATATLLTTIVSLDPIYAYFEADEQAYMKYVRLDKSGERRSSRDVANPVRLALADEEGYPHQGRMNFVENRIDVDTATIQGRAVFDNPDFILIPGQFVRLQLLGSSPHQAVLIPDEAVVSDQSQKFVWIVNAENKAEYRKVKPGPLNDGLRVMSEGLKPNERVIVLGLQNVRPGIAVEAKEEPIQNFVAGAAGNTTAPVSTDAKKKSASGQ
ncbi:MAG: efflux RND transporter periplasmic adaptor subunit [Chthoniobacterales bacterium]|nr:efflux RND transporter periplasmic adaptor subunit [Chthoniobacterales bacterium]